MKITHDRRYWVVGYYRDRDGVTRHLYILPTFRITWRKSA